jgi:hemerythrin superfamily protein
MDAIEMLTNDHNKVRELFKKFNGGGGITGLVRRSIGGVSTAERKDALDRICDELEVHTRIEEDVFYPAVTALDDRELGNQVKEALREHATVKREVARLRGSAGDDSGLDDLMADLERNVEHHASEEENELFPRLEALMSEDERVELATRMRALKRGGSRSRRTSAKKKSAASTSKSRSRQRKAPAAARASSSRKHVTTARPKKKSSQRGGRR